jgi:hypothetical protein
VADGKSNAPIDLVMEIAMAVTSNAAGTVGKDTLWPMKRKETGTRRRMSEVPKTTSALRDWWRYTERVAQQQASEPAQLHRTSARN